MKVDQEIEARVWPAPRVTAMQVENAIANEDYFTAAQGVIGARGTVQFSSPLLLLTFCVLTLRNGFMVTGESACASPENFDAEIGKRLARQNAVIKVWPLLGFSLRERLHQGS